VGKGLLRVFFSKEGQAGLELPKGFRIHHGLTSSARANRGCWNFQEVGAIPRGAKGVRAKPYSGALKKKVPRSQEISGTASATAARKVPIPVIFERT